MFCGTGGLLGSRNGKKITPRDPFLPHTRLKKLIFSGGYGARYAGFRRFGCNWRLSVTTGWSVCPILVLLAREKYQKVEILTKIETFCLLGATAQYGDI